MVGIIMVGTLGIVLIATIMVMPTTIRGIGVITMRGIVRGTIIIRTLIAITTTTTTTIRCTTNRTMAEGRTTMWATTMLTLRTKPIVCSTTAQDVMVARVRQ